MIESEFSAIFEDRESAEKVVQAFPDPDSTSLGSVRSLDGSIGDWIILGTAALNSLTPVLLAIRQFVNSGRVKSIKVGDIEIVNPSREQVDRLLEVAKNRSIDLQDDHPDSTTP